MTVHTHVCINNAKGDIFSFDKRKDLVKTAPGFLFTLIWKQSCIVGSLYDKDKEQYEESAKDAEEDDDVYHTWAANNSITKQLHTFYNDPYLYINYEM